MQLLAASSFPEISCSGVKVLLVHTNAHFIYNRWLTLKRYKVEVAVIKLASGVETVVTKLASGVPWNAGDETKDGAVEVPLARLKPNTHALLSAYVSASSLAMIRALVPESPRELHT